MEDKIVPSKTGCLFINCSLITVVIQCGAGGAHASSPGLTPVAASHLTIAADHISGLRPDTNITGQVMLLKISPQQSPFTLYCWTYSWYKTVAS